MVKVDCPSCGAPITFESTFSILAICSHCNSTLVRHDMDVENIGKMATLKEDGSPLQLGTRGEYKGVSFSVVGRIQLRFDRGIWNEWYLTFNDGTAGWLGEAQGTYAVSFQKKTDQELPEFGSLTIGKALTLHGKKLHVQNVEQARCIAGQGELPFRVNAGYDAPLVDLLGDGGAFATIDYSEDPPLVFVGEYVEFDDFNSSNLRTIEGWSNTARPKVRAFQCRQCGAPVTSRGLLQTLVVVCPSCGGVIDISDENLTVLRTFTAKARVTPAIPIGTRGKFSDGEFEVIGFLQRHVTVESVNYPWREYLLFNPYKGFRWLSEYNGHWSYIKSTLIKPKTLTTSEMSFQGEVFQHFQSATAIVDYVIGEFYWRVEANESCLVSDFVAPPKSLSVEKADRDISYSIGEYMEPDLISAAFGLKTALPARIGVGSSQPSPYTEKATAMWNSALAFLMLAIAIQIAFVALSQNKLVYQTDLAYNAAAAEKSLVTDVFELKGRSSNVRVNSSANVSNNYLYLSMALVNDDTGTAYDFGREIGYYYGSDADGAWSEGSQSDQVYLPSVPAGHYYLRVEPEGPASTSYSIKIYRDVPRWWFFLIAVGLILLPPIFASLQKRNFEFQRWSESDHPMNKFINTEGDDDE